MNVNKSKIYRLISFGFFLFAILSGIQNSVIAQVASSPYSRYALGSISEKGFVQNVSMGGTYIAMQNDTVPMLFINNGNPASYSNMRLVTAELGAKFNRVQLESSSTKSTVTNASFGYLGLAFPIKKWWGISAGLLPFSSVDYKISAQSELASVGTVNYLYEGTGGLNQLYFGTGLKPFSNVARKYQQSSKYKQLNTLKHPDNSPKSCREVYETEKKIRGALNRKNFVESLSLGVNASYLFGNIKNARRSVFPYTSGALNTASATNTRIEGFAFDYGMQMAYTIDSVAHKDKADTCRPVKFRDLKENVKLLVGVTFSSQAKLNANIDSLTYNYTVNSNGLEISKDTVGNTQDTKGKIKIPITFGFGIGIKKGLKWYLAADFAFQNWGEYTAFGETQGLRNSMRTSLGVQYIPDSRANSRYFKRVNYRGGFKYAQTYLELKDNPLNEYGVTLGLGFPVGRSIILQNFSMVNICAELGQRGTVSDGLIKEKYIKLTVGFTMNDKWFNQPKFD